MNMQTFRSTVWKHWKKHGRHNLAWRKTKDPYRILVSEVMLQQTQVSRVTEKYKEFLKAFPTVRALAKAPLRDVLRVWSGLGYNRRGKYLHDAAKIIVGKCGGRVPRDTAALWALPGIGEYTASAIRVFAFNEPDTLIETNIRAAFIHHFFPQTRKVHDRDVRVLIKEAAEGQDPREWHWALMDYGVNIKKLHKNPTRKSAHYARQSKFEGSLRQVRGVIVRELHKGSQFEVTLQVSGQSRDRLMLQKALAGLERDKIIVHRKRRWSIAH